MHRSLEWKVEPWGYDWKVADSDFWSTRTSDERVTLDATWFKLCPSRPQVVLNKGDIDEAYAYLDASLATFGKSNMIDWFPPEPKIRISGDNNVRTTSPTQGAIRALTEGPLKYWDRSPATLGEVRAIQSYSPFSEHSGLFLKFKDTIPTARGLLEFANKYGRLGMEGGRVDYLHNWYFQVITMRQAVEIWDMLKGLKMAKRESGKILQRLEKHFRWQGKKGEEYVLYDSHPELGEREEVMFPECRVQIPIPDVKYFKDLSTVNVAQLFLMEIMKCHIPGHAYSALVWTDEPENAPPRKRNFLQPKNMRMTRMMIPEDLLGGLWLQFEEAVYGNKDYKLCAREGCGEWYGASSSRADRKYHSDACKTEANRELHERIREMYCEEMALGKLSKERVVKKIAKELGQEEEYVKKWISN